MSYRFDRAVKISPHVVRLRPAAHCRTPVLAYSMTVTPEEHFVNWQQDPFGNHLARLVFPEPARELTVTVDLIADLAVINPFDFFVEDSAEHYPFAYDEMLRRDLAPYLSDDEPGPLVTRWLDAWSADPASSANTGPIIVDFLVELNQRVFRSVAYTTRMEPGVQTPDETLEKAIGSCRDSAWLLVHILRRLGLAARFVSGYLVQLRPDEVPVDGPAGPLADFTDLHAWAEVYVPGAGWIGLDPTSGLLAGEGHLPLVCAPHPTTAAPITGSTDPCEVTFEHSNTVRRLAGPPRVTLPYTDEQWMRIDTLGHEVDKALAAGDVRLTLGGEPTFVAADDMEADEWTIAADGADKRARAEVLARRLLDRFAPGGFLHYGQGKWYPGEPLPRWQITALWRADGEPLWNDRSLLADSVYAPEAHADASAALGPDTAATLVRSIAKSLALPDDCCIAAYEHGDAHGDPVGWVIPLHPETDAGPTGARWATTRWNLPGDGLTLIPGDSPMGARLPLDALTAQPSTSEDPEPEDLPRTALCVEERERKLFVYLPPIESVDHSIDLIGVVEQAAAALGRALVVEGYLPPIDPRLVRLAITPDPGVIEVNVHPAASWPELVDITTGVHADARATRLGTETFHLDGTHAGTGGGNHLTLGGPTPADSPLLRSPDLLRSIITYWQHHPSLSYLFSGRFIGPTSQAPRVDEARHESLYELEIAFAELEQETAKAAASKTGGTVAPELVDRLFRQLLVDVTGSTHRAELCVDKLFSPETDRGRLGLLELRGFEMPPHPQMALVQALLVRALVARFSAEPYTGPLVRWGTELHDRFLLPFYAAADIAEVVDDLVGHGFEFDSAWLAPFFEFRFPRIGAVGVDGVTLELRGAIEPWSVLGEEVTSTGTSRYVDSSVERLQVKVDGLTRERHVVTCNGVPIPLHSTGAPGGYVAGVRYKAWQPPSGLHPTIGIQAPLVFDVLDRWNRRSLGGCTYHVTHPGGRSYDRFPVNANEAEARRASRFTAGGHTPGPIDMSVGYESLEYPRTLDLRRAPFPRGNPGPRAS